MNRFALLASSAVVLAATSLHYAQPQAATTPDTWMAVKGERARAPKAAAPIAWRDAQLPAHASVRLTFAPLAPERIEALAKRNRQMKATQSGIHRRSDTESTQKALPALRWAATADGGAAARIVIRSPKANGLRVGLRLQSLDPRVELRFAGSNAPATVVGKVTGEQALVLADPRGLFWTPSTEGDTQTIELYAPAGVKTQGVRVQVPTVSHLLATAASNFKFDEKAGESGACNVDTICRVNELGQHFVNAKDAVAHMVFSTNEGTYICTGTLLTDTVAATQVPYFYSANHCISDQTVASTLETYWKMEATACGNNTEGPTQQLLGGATYLYSNANTDALLMRLNAAPPAGSYFAAWDSTPLAASVNATAIHHPKGDLKKVSLGQHMGSDADLITMAWTSGTTEGGSSGSGLFTSTGNGYFLRGGLYGGDALCSNSGSTSNPLNRDWYSRFDVAFPHIQQYLAPPQAVVVVQDDFNGDKKADVLWRNGGTGANDVWRSALAASRQITSTVPDLNWKMVGVADFNGDTKADVLWRNHSTGANDIWLSALSSTRQAVQTEASQNWQVAVVGDFNGDGKGDIFWRNTSTGATRLWPSANGSLSQTMATIADANWKIVGVGDFANDGKDDVLWRNSATGANLLWRSGNSTQQQTLTAVTTLAWTVVGTGDFDKDGKSDILWRNTSTGANLIWRSGVSSTQQAVATVPDQNYKVAQVADFNGDGADDIFWRSFSNGNNEMWPSGNAAQRIPLVRVADQNWKIIP